MNQSTGQQLEAAAENITGQLTFGSEQERMSSFSAAVEQIRVTIFGQVGPKDMRRVRRVNAASRVFEAAGRLLIHFSFEPLTFALGIFLLFLRKQLHMLEIGHPALHGTYDQLGGGKRFSAKTFCWDTPIDEASWRYGHNIRHHQATNVGGKDADIHLGPVRLTYQTPFHPIYYVQLLQLIFIILPGFLFWMGAHFSGAIDLLCGNRRPERFDFLSDRSWASCRLALRRAGRKWVRFYGKNYVFYPLLAGPFFWKVMLGNFLADTLCNLFSGLGIICSHSGPEVKAFPTGTKARSHGEWCAMQVEAASNLAVSYPISVLLGAVDCQIEHHLFPTLPPERLRQIAPEVQAICIAHGIEYRRESWPRTLYKSLRHIGSLSRPGSPDEVYPALRWFTSSLHE